MIQRPNFQTLSSLTLLIALGLVANSHLNAQTQSRRKGTSRRAVAEHEARAISRQYPPSQVATLVGSRAEERLVRELAPGQAVIHLATHGVIRDDEPLESFLVLALGKASRQELPQVN